MGLIQAAKRKAGIAYRQAKAQWRDDGYFGGFDRHQCIFLHVPRSAGVSVCQALFGYLVGHRTYHHYLCANPDKANAYLKFTFVRNPWDRLVSAYFFLKKGGQNPDDARFGREVIARYPDFESFVMGWLSREKVMGQVHFRPQHVFMNPSGQLGDLIIKAEMVGRFENIAQDFAAITEELGIDAELPHTNASGHQAYQEHYTPESRDKVAQIYFEDIVTFGYRFED